MGRLAILSGDGALPVALSAAHPDALCVCFEGVAHQVTGMVENHRFERLGEMFDALRAAGVTRVVMAGSMSRPPLDPAALDPFMIALAPRLMAAMQGGDDALLRLIIAVIEDEGFTVLGAHELLKGLTAEPALLVGSAPDEAATADIIRAADILTALSPHDVGQGCVVAGGLVLAVETLQGTEFMLDTVRRTAPHLRRGSKGVFVKAAKKGQDLRVDMPAIGPDTVAQVAAAGLAGIAVQAEHVMILERDQTISAAHKAGIFIIGQVFEGLS
ncbi:LpxI family protein [Thalassobius sp. Cn5-15]|uniref:LpxI family protein n=1 Tax=Thalassobius sp. Cn5-15 TaxID=2917763 RepID=UPI001EF248B3|nr:UDP-2,3-diacylglucosamine diphosphatase LpxI [Thalassobius sp. Cn5-15]MCG7492595.1 UDP-2,3-diacylglucosamine diphosphatase LpxI [Thalassobius sp. Cn5-15]